MLVLMLQLHFIGKFKKAPQPSKMFLKKKFSLKSLRAASRICATGIREEVNNLMYSRYGFKDLNETSFLNLLKPYFRPNKINEQNFCLDGKPEIKFAPTLTSSGFC